MSKYKLHLFVSGNSSSSLHAIKNLNEICQHPDIVDLYEIEIIDVLKNPELANQAELYTTPTLLRSEPFPPVCIIGKLQEQEMIVSMLQIGEE